MLNNESLIQLDLKVCKDLKVDVSVPVIITGNIDKVNSSSGYYNDICYTYTSEDGTDISLADRKKEFVNNDLTVCEEDCDFVDYDYNIGKAGCSCKVKTESTTKIGDIVIDKDKLYNSFTDYKNIANIKVLKCYKLIFKLEAYKSNYANLILIVIIFLYFITLIIFYCKDYKYLIKILNLIVFFKLNPKLVKIFIDREKKSKMVIKKNLNKVNKKDNLINEISKKDKKEKSDSNNEFKIMGVKIERPLYLDYIDIIYANKLNININKNKLNEDENKPNPNKRNKRNKSLIIKDNEMNLNNKKRNEDLLRRLPSKNKKQKIIYERKELIGDLSENELYEMFLKINKYSHKEMNEFNYKKAIKNDGRTYCQYYVSLILTKHSLFFSFKPAFDYNSYTLKIFLFFFLFTLNFVVNALFFNDATMHQIYEDKGSFNFIYNLPQIALSALISGIIGAIIQYLALTSSILTELKEKGKKENIDNLSKDAMTNMKIKSIFFFFFCLILLIFFWFYLGCFCAVYKNTQLHLIKD